MLVEVGLEELQVEEQVVAVEEQGDDDVDDYGKDLGVVGSQNCHDYDSEDC